MVTAVKAVRFSPSPPTVPERIGEALTSAYRWNQDWGSRRAVSLNFLSTGQRLNPPKKNISWAPKLFQTQQVYKQEKGEVSTIEW